MASLLLPYLKESEFIEEYVLVLQHIASALDRLQKLFLWLRSINTFGSGKKLKRLESSTLRYCQSLAHVVFSFYKES